MNLQNIPLCVPRWDEREAFREGAEYSDSLGFYIPADAYLGNVRCWLPRKWLYPGEPQLLPEMLPSSSWEDNLRTAIPEKKWDALRRHCYAAAGNRCEVCGAKGMVECHEAWEFDDVMGIQYLTGLLSLCQLCHKSKHLGYARRLGIYPQVIKQMMWVNNWSPKELDEALARAKAEVNERDKFYWHVDMSWLTEGRYNLVYRLEGN